MRLRHCLIFVMAACVATSAVAQDRGDNKRTPSLEKGRKVQDGEGARMIGPLRVLVAEVNLDDEQMGRVMEIWNAHAQAEKKLRGELQPPPEIAEKMGELRRQMQAAYDARDKEKVEELRKQLEAVQAERTKAIAPLREKLDQLQDKLHDDLKAVMRPDQVDLFERVWGEQMDRREVRRAFLRSPNALKAAVDRLRDLTPGQKEDLQNTFDEFKDWMRLAREKPAEYASQRKARTKKLYDDVLAHLTKEQREKVTKELEPNRPKARHNKGDAKAKDMAADTKKETSAKKGE